jgi:hypothetical protein
MKEKKSILKLWCFKGWQFEHAEAWLSDMAKQGWRLEHIGLKFAKFVKCEPSAIQYRCIPHTGFPANIDDYKQAGWKYLTSSLELYIFNSKAMDPVQEVDSVDKASRIKMLRSKLTRRTFWAFVGLFAIFLRFFFLFNSPKYTIQYLLHCETSVLFDLMIIVSYFLYQVISCQIVLKERARVKKDQKISNQPYLKIRTVSKRFHIVFLLLLVVGFIPYQNPYQLYESRKAMQLPNDMITLSISDIHPELADNATLDNEGYSGIVFHSIIYPDQILMLSDLFSPEISGKNSVVLIEYESYRAITPWMAVLLAEQLTKKYEVYTDTGFIPIPESKDVMGFDRLWLNDWRYEHKIVAVKGNTVYYIEYNEVTDDKLGKSTVSSIEIVEILKSKIALLVSE